MFDVWQTSFYCMSPFTFTHPTVAGLPEHFEPPGEQSFASTAANPADSDNDQD